MAVSAVRPNRAEVAARRSAMQHACGMKALPQMTIIHCPPVPLNPPPNPDPVRKCKMQAFQASCAIPVFAFSY